MPSLEQEALGEIKQALLKLHLKSSRELRLVADTALEIVFPGSGMSSQFKVHGRSEWAQFKVDMAYMLVTRDDNFFRRSVKNGWADSSPQGPFDFLFRKNRYIYMTELLATADAMVTLVNTTGGALGGEVADDFEISLETLEARSSANKVLKKNVREHFYASILFVLFVDIILLLLLSLSLLLCVAGVLEGVVAPLLLSMSLSSLSSPSPSLLSSSLCLLWLLSLMS